MSRAVFVALVLFATYATGQNEVDIRKLEAAERERLQAARDFMAKNPAAVRKEFEAPILAQRVVEGMCPTEAQLAAGRFFYSVKNDPKWPSGTNPLRIIGAQCAEPDDSEITMTFMTRTQYDDWRPTVFKVIVKKGRVESIERGKTAE
jgi:hypothetical protein